MEPSYKEGKRVLVQKKWFFCTMNIGDAIVLQDPRNGKLIIKRIHRKKDKKEYFVLGDNAKESTDSREFGWVEWRNILGKVMIQ